MKRLLIVTAVLLSFACNKKDGENTLIVGATPVPHAAILEFVKEDLAAKGIKLEVIEFTDYITPNLSLESGQLDANFFQHRPYLENFNRERGLSLVSAGGVHVEPLGVYSKKHTSLDNIPYGATVGIPNDHTNEGRALLLLDMGGYIKLSGKARLEKTPLDIIENPHNFGFIELDAAKMSSMLGDLDYAVINGNYALIAGLNPLEDALLLEGAFSPYVNIVVIRQESKTDLRIQALMEALTSAKVKEFINKTYNGSVMAAF